jgi:crossover junction endodeoxyribonuclease RuvC
MRILGIDPGLRITGFGVIDKRGAAMHYVTSGVIRTPDSDLPTRLGVIAAGLHEVIEANKPDQSAIEKVFLNMNPATTMLLGHARGAAICALVQAELPVSEYTALQIKQGIVGYGKAKKEQIQLMVQRMLALAGLPGPDAADALACAICHAQSSVMATTLTSIAPELSRRGARFRGGRLVR